MKKERLFLTALFAFALAGSAWAEGTATDDSGVRYVKTPRFARPIVERWIAEYAKVEPGVKFEIAKGGQTVADLTVTLDSRTASKSDVQHTVFFAESAVLPITARDSEADKALGGKRLNAKWLRQLYFLNDDLEEDVKKNKVFEQLTVYSGSNASSVAASFARNLGEETGTFRGKRISGDDLFLNTAIQKDPQGVTFNALPNVFDLQSRRLKADLSLIGIDVKRDLEPSFSNQAQLDDLIGVLENGRVQEVAVEKVGLSYNGVDDAVTRFIDWVLSSGTKWNHQYGLLNLDRKLAEAQKEKVKSNFTAQK